MSVNAPAGQYFDGRYWKVKAEGHPSVANMPIKHQYVSRARLVMEAKLGRFLEDWEHVYHKDGDTTNDDEDNLEIIANISEHNKKYRWRKKKKTTK